MSAANPCDHGEDGRGFIPFVFSPTMFGGNLYPLWVDQSAALWGVTG